MSLERFAAYAAAFEKAFENDDWSVVEPFFTENAVYETFAVAPFGGRHEGRDAVMAQFKTVLDTFDRRFDVRELQPLEGPEERDGSVWMRWRVTYKREGMPDIVLDGEETAFFEGDRIRRLEDRMPEESVKGVTETLGAHGDKLLPVGG